MNRDDVIAALDQVLDPDSEIHKAAAQLYTDDRVRIHMLSEPIAAVLKAQDEFKDGVGFMIQLDSGFVGFEPGMAAALLVNRARELGSSAAAVDWLEKVIATTKARGLCIMALRGITLEQKVDLAGGVSIWPLDELPPSAPKQRLKQRVEMRTQVHLPPPSLWKPPQAALVCHATIEPFLVKAPPPEQSDPLGRMQLLDHIRLCLTCIGPCTAIPATSWFQFEDKDLNAAVAGLPTTHQYIEVMPTTLKDPGSLDPGAARAAVSSYLKLSGRLKKQVTIALARLSQAMCRRDAGDAAVDLAIAFEALLVDTPGEHTHKVGLRAALLLGGDSETRLNNRSIARGIYGFRNKLLHRGAIESSKRELPSGEKVTPSELVDKGTAVCAALIRRVLDRGALPAWDQFELSGG